MPMGPGGPASGGAPTGDRREAQPPSGGPAAPAVMVARSPSLTRCDIKELQRWVADVKQFAAQAGTSGGLLCDVLEESGALAPAKFHFDGDARTVEIGAFPPAAMRDLLVIGSIADEP